MAIGKCTDVFRGILFLDKEGGWLEDLSMEEFPMRGKNFHERSAGFSNIA